MLTRKLFLKSNAIPYDLDYVIIFELQFQGRTNGDCFSGLWVQLEVYLMASIGDNAIPCVLDDIHIKLECEICFSKIVV